MSKVIGPLQQRMYGAAGGEDLLHRAQYVRQHPAFAEAVKIFTHAMADFRLNGPRLVNKLLGQDVRFRTVCFVYYLQHEKMTGGDGDEGPTYSRVLDLVQNSIGGSQRVVTTTLEMLLAMGLVTIERGVRDGRLKIYRPTPSMYELLRAWLTGCFAALDIIEPGANRIARLRADDGIMTDFILGVGRDFRDNEPLTERVPEFACFFHREGGGPLLAMAITAGYAGTTLPSRGEIAAKFGLSKTQIASLANDAIGNGLLSTQSNGSLRPTAKLVSCYELWSSIAFAFYMRASEPQCRQSAELLQAAQ